MNTLLVIIHILAVVVVVGPAMLLPFTAIPALHAHDAERVSLAGRRTLLFNGLTLVAAVLGILAALTADENVFAEVWMVISATLYVLALINGLVLLPPLMANAASALADGAADLDVEKIERRSGRLAGFAWANIALYSAVIILMTWQP